MLGAGAANFKKNKKKLLNLYIERELCYLNTSKSATYLNHIKGDCVTTKVIGLNQHKKIGLPFPDNIIISHVELCYNALCTEFCHNACLVAL